MVFVADFWFKFCMLPPRCLLTFGHSQYVYGVTLRITNGHTHAHRRMDKAHMSAL